MMYTGTAADSIDGPELRSHSLCVDKDVHLQDTFACPKETDVLKK